MGNYSRSVKDARDILQKISELEFSATYLLTPSGFVVMPWKFSSFGEAVNEGLKFSEMLLEGIEINADHFSWHRFLQWQIDQASSRAFRRLLS